MPTEKPDYEVNDDFNKFASDLVAHFPEKFNDIDVSKICCVNITNNSRSDKDKKSHKRIWKLEAVKMPMAMHCKYSYYVILYSDEWDEMDEKHQLAVVSDVFHGIDPETEKVIPCDFKGYTAVHRTLGLEYETDPNIPHLLKDKVEWK